MCVYFDFLCVVFVQALQVCLTYLGLDSTWVSSFNAFGLTSKLKSHSFLYLKRNSNNFNFSCSNANSLNYLAPFGTPTQTHILSF